MHLSIWSSLKLQHFHGIILDGKHALEVNSLLSQPATAPEKKRSLLIAKPLKLFRATQQWANTITCPLKSRVPISLNDLYKDADHSVPAAWPILSHTCKWNTVRQLNNTAFSQTNSFFSLKCFVHLWANCKWSHELQHTILSKYISPEIGSSQLCNFSYCCNDEHTDRYKELGHSIA